MFSEKFSLFRGECQVERKKLLTPRNELSEPLQPERNVCLNPWNGRCGNTDIALYIFYRGRRIPICRECWVEIASDDIEWRCD